MRCEVKMTTMVLLAILVCAGCREETTGAGQVSQVPSPNQYDSPHDQKRDERVIAIECEMTNMPQKLAGDGWETMLWGCDLVKDIMELDDREERIRLMKRYLDSVSKVAKSIWAHRDLSLAFCNYEELIGASTIFKGEPEMAERILGIMCDSIRLHRREVQKWSDAINNEQNHRKRVSMKNVHGCLDSYFMMFTNEVERTYFPRMKSHGLPPDRHEYWRRQINDAYESQRRTEADIREHREQEEAYRRDADVRLNGKIVPLRPR